MTVWNLDNNDFYIGFIELTEENKDTLNYTTKPMTVGYYKPRFNREIDDWEEGATAEEIDQIKTEEEANRQPPSEDKNTILSEKVEALAIENQGILEYTVDLDFRLATVEMFI